MSVIVLVTKGKRESVDYARVCLFESTRHADAYIEAVSTGSVKYWTKAEIVGDGEEVELYMPEGEWE